MTPDYWSAQDLIDELEEVDDIDAQVVLVVNGVQYTGFVINEDDGSIVQLRVET